MHRNLHVEKRKRTEEREGLGTSLGSCVVRNGWGGTSLAIQWLRLCRISTAGAWVQSLVGEIISRRPCSAARKKKMAEGQGREIFDFKLFGWSAGMFLSTMCLQITRKNLLCTTTSCELYLGGVKVQKGGSRKACGTSLVVQWLRIRLPMQGTQVRALVWEDPTCHGATKPVRHNYWAWALEPTSHNYWSPHAYSLCSATREATIMRSTRTPMKGSPCSPQLEKASAQQWRPNAAKNK